MMYRRKVDLVKDLRNSVYLHGVSDDSFNVKLVNTVEFKKKINGETDLPQLNRK